MPFKSETDLWRNSDAFPVALFLGASAEARQRTREDERDRSLKCESTGSGDMRKGMGFGSVGHPFSTLKEAAEAALRGGW